MMSAGEQAAWDDGFRTALRWVAAAAAEAAKGDGKTVLPPVRAVHE